jgi:hypothetical protein
MKELPQQLLLLLLLLPLLLLLRRRPRRRWRPRWQRNNTLHSRNQKTSAKGAPAALLFAPATPPLHPARQ